MNGRHLPADRRSVSVRMLPPPLWPELPDLPPLTDEEGWEYARQEMLDGSHRVIPHERYDYFEEIRK